MKGGAKSPNKAPTLMFGRPDCTVLEECLSTTGKYQIYLGVHYEHSIPCWVIGAVSKVTGIRSERHLNEKIETPDGTKCLAPQATAYAMWEEFKTEMTRRPENEYEDPLEGLREHIQRKPEVVFTNKPKLNPWIQ